ncbi:hypothetical protein SMACR_03447 [Sordaria macrospora]|uniref:WGS project CABT00000000 data, contig 2.10 n=2 Tax=Sordaria macrospora TaxID=5147 RepID=F7VW69_SORMK|nr:uncharacterized protein SMAC_03447 [Sordaria macrospora k-hell]KAA8632987.1 hypothetical protein SMACR_03447 [Sordaria macrospora]KAH7629897.1 hypothetical protein B0T09DRAFT_340540 [Sordaria sp. MPI-SDFR-AT-0083]WPJ66592.1 hypothetical protein SMAC4_03447 [Sordaria macrospora]CCC09891.1 unnamed protein product [Sordaria macrospora k-hell]
MSPPTAPGAGAPPPFSSTPDPTPATTAAISNLMPPPPPLLLSKRVTAFLHANLSPYVRTAALTTPAGKLLAHASNGLSAGALRRQCAVAASLWGLHHPSGSGYGGGDGAHAAEDHHVIGSPTGSTASQSTVGTVRGGAAGGGGGLRARPVPGQAVTVQMDNGLVFVIRRLRCGMLFICMGGEEGNGGNGKQSGETEANGEGPPTSQLDPGHQHHLPLRAGPHRTPTSSSATSARLKREADLPGENTPLSTSNNTVPSASTSQGSNTNAVNNATAAARGPSASSVRAMRRQVEELARWLDERLGTLYVPEEGIGLGFGGSPGVEVR